YRPSRRLGGSAQLRTALESCPKSSGSRWLSDDLRLRRGISSHRDRRLPREQTGRLQCTQEPVLDAEEEQRLACPRADPARAPTRTSILVGLVLLELDERFSMVFVQPCHP